MNFDVKDLPYAQFEKLGMSKKEVLSMKPEDLRNMLEGGRTGILTFSVEIAGGKRFETDAKLSLYRNPDNSLSLNVHPIRAEIKNDIGATTEELERLKKGEFLIKEHPTLNGEREKQYFQLDRETNEILRARVRDLVVPNAIKDIVLSSDQKEHLRQGKTLELESKAGKELIRVQVDLTQPRGYAIRPEAVNIASGIKMNEGGQDIKPSGPKR